MAPTVDYLVIYLVGCDIGGVAKATALRSCQDATHARARVLVYTIGGQAHAETPEGPK